MSNTLDDLLRRFLARWAEEIPAGLHVHGIWVGRPAPDTPPELVGGSLLHAPAYNPAFRARLEDSPFKTEPAQLDGSLTREVHYRTPLLAALATLPPLMRGFLVEVACNGGDWEGPAMRRNCYNPDIARVYAREALVRLERRYAIEPRAPTPRRDGRRNRSDDVPWTEKSESQQRSEDDAA